MFIQFTFFPAKAISSTADPGNANPTHFGLFHLLVGQG